MFDSACPSILPSEWENRQSPSSIAPSFFNAFAQPDFFTRLSKLLDGLDKPDKAVICRAISAMQKMFSGADPASIFSAEECAEIRCWTEDIVNHTVKIKEDLYCYKGYFLPISHFAMDIFANNLSYDLLRNPSYIQGKDIIDAGGYCGDSALILSQWTTGLVHVFEPVASHVQLASQTIAYNNLRNCMINPMGLGEKNQETEIAFFGSGSSINKFTPQVFSQLNRQIIKVVALDDYVKNADLKVGFIKVDIEGYEQPFLRGALHTITTQRPVLFISIYHNADDFFNIKPFLESLDLGYKFRISKVPNGSIMVETALIAEPA